MRALLLHQGSGTTTASLELAAWVTRTMDTHLEIVNWFSPPFGPNPKFEKWFHNQVKETKQMLERATAAADIRSWSFAPQATTDPVLAVAAAQETPRLVITTNQQLAVHLAYCGSTPVLYHPGGNRLAKRGITRVTYALTGTVPAGLQEQITAAAARTAAFLNRDLRLALIGHHPFDQSQHKWREQALVELDTAHDVVEQEAPQLAVESCVSSGRDWGSALAGCSWKKGDVLLVGPPTVTTLDLLTVAPVPVILLPAQDFQATSPLTTSDERADDEPQGA